MRAELRVDVLGVRGGGIAADEQGVANVGDGAKLSCPCVAVLLGAEFVAGMTVPKHPRSRVAALPVKGQLPFQELPLVVEREHDGRNQQHDEHGGNPAGGQCASADRFAQRLGNKHAHQVADVHEQPADRIGLHRRCRTAVPPPRSTACRRRAVRYPIRADVTAKPTAAVPRVPA